MEGIGSFCLKIQFMYGKHLGYREQWFFHNTVDVVMPPNFILAILQSDKYHYVYFTIIKEAILYSMLLPSMLITKSKKHQFLSISSLCLWKLCFKNLLCQNGLVTPIWNCFWCRLFFSLHLLNENHPEDDSLLTGIIASIWKYGCSVNGLKH